MNKNIRKNRTRGAQSQWEFDNLLSDSTYNELKFLSKKYSIDLKDFRESHDINNQENSQTYKKIQQRKKMIDEDRQNRIKLMNSESKKDLFYPETGMICDNTGKVISSISFNKDENEIIYNQSGNRGKKDENWEIVGGDDNIGIDDGKFKYQNPDNLSEWKYWKKEDGQ